jgi:hypothetical protein
MDALYVEEEDTWVGRLMAGMEVGSGIRAVQRVALVVGVGALIMVLKR